MKASDIYLAKSGGIFLFLHKIYVENVNIIH